MGGVTLRDATIADLPVLQDLYRRSSLSNDADRDNLLAHPDALLLSGGAIRQGRSRVAVSVEGNVIGFHTIEVVDGALELVDLFVDPDFMRQGVGRQLTGDAVGIALSKGVRRLEVTANPHALAFYTSAGFVVDGRADTEFGPGVRMHRDA